MKNNSKKNNSFRYWLIHFGLFWVAIVYPIFKSFNVYQYGWKEAFSMDKILFEILIFTITTVLLSWGIWYFVARKQLTY